MNKRIYGLGSVLAIASVIPFAVACSSAKYKTISEEKINEIQLLTDTAEKLKLEYAELSNIADKVVANAEELSKQHVGNVEKFMATFKDTVKYYLKIKSKPITFTISNELKKELGSDHTIFDDIKIGDLKNPTHFDPTTALSVVQEISKVINDFRSDVTTRVGLILAKIKKIEKEIKDQKELNDKKNSELDAVAGKVENATKQIEAGIKKAADLTEKP